jgi:hypothetical protein
MVARELLRLQRAAGNAAVARRTLQRKIGFELEPGKWKSAWLDRDPQGDEEATGAVPRGVATQPPTARKALEMTVAEAKPKAVGLRLAAYVAKLTARQVTWI